MHLQSSSPELSFQRKLKKKMNNNQNSAVLIKFNVVLQFLISLNYIHNWLQIFNFVHFSP